MINSRNTLGTGDHGGRWAVLTGIALALSALALMAVDGRAQDRAEVDVEGLVVDAESGQPLVAAWVGMTDTGRGAITDDAGRFRLPGLPAGYLALTVEQLGYETLEWTGMAESGAGPLRLALTPRPIILEGLQVVTDRFENRRRAVTTSVMAYEPEDLNAVSGQSALEFVRNRVNSSFVPCRSGFGGTCLWLRGRVVEPRVYIDEMPVLGGLDYLDTFEPWELYMIEVYSRGSHIRAYTHRFMERAAKQRLHPIPIGF